MDIVTLQLMRMVTSVLEIAAAWKAALLAKDSLVWKLFKTNVAINPGTGLGSLVEADYSGYSPIAVASLNGPALDTSKNGYLTTPVAYFTNNGGGVANQIYSAALCGSVDGGTAATGTATASGGAIATVAVSGGGSGYQAPPLVTVGGGGVGAVVTATVVAGVVTALTIVDPGSGYTSPTLTIEPPLEILHGLNLPSPVPMNVATDALPLVGQINIPPGTP